MGGGLVQGEAARGGAAPGQDALASESLARGAACWSCPVEVRFHEVDAAGIVYFPRLISYFHDAYVRYLAERGLPLHDAITTSPWIAPIRHVEADFLRPVRFGDRLVASLVRARASGSAVSLGWRLATDASGDGLRATGRTVHAFADRSFRRAPVPEEFLRLFDGALAA